jgi:hypothetical protein
VISALAAILDCFLPQRQRAPSLRIYTQPTDTPYAGKEWFGWSELLSSDNSFVKLGDVNLVKMYTFPSELLHGMYVFGFAARMMTRNPIYSTRQKKRTEMNG